LLRLILASVVLYHLGLLINVEDAVSVSEDTLASVAPADLSVLPVELNVIQVTPDLKLQLGKQNEKDQQEKNYDEIRQYYQQKVREMIAMFAFRLEADSRSRCNKAIDSNVIELNDYEILEITRDKSAKYGYQFEVKKCISPAFPLR
jgi:5-methylthioribose kinase